MKAIDGEPFLLKAMEDKTIVKIFTDMRLDFDGEPVELMFEGGINSYSNIGVSVVSPDNHKTWIPYYRISRIQELAEDSTGGK